jgi:hypothetical protein
MWSTLMSRSESIVSTELILIASTLFAQQSAQKPATTFKSKAGLVLVPMVVTKSGHPAEGLQRDFIDTICPVIDEQRQC